MDPLPPTACDHWPSEETAGDTSPKQSCRSWWWVLSYWRLMPPLQPDPGEGAQTVEDLLSGSFQVLQRVQQEVGRFPSVCCCLCMVLCCSLLGRQCQRRQDLQTEETDQEGQLSEGKTGHCWSFGRKEDAEQIVIYSGITLTKLSSCYWTGSGTPSGIDRLRSAATRTDRWNLFWLVH